MASVFSADPQLALWRTGVAYSTVKRAESGRDPGESPEWEPQYAHKVEPVTFREALAETHEPAAWVAGAMSAADARASAAPQLRRVSICGDDGRFT